MTATPNQGRGEQMTGTTPEESQLSGLLRLTWVTDHLNHVLTHSQTDETAGTWTGLACPARGLQAGTDVDNATLQRLAQGEIADLIWEAPADLAAGHGELLLAAIGAHQSGHLEEGEQYWQQAQALWARAW